MYYIRNIASFPLSLNVYSYYVILSPFVTYERLLDSEDAAALPLFYFLALRSSKNLDLPCNIGYLYFSLLLTIQFMCI